MDLQANFKKSAHNLDTDENMKLSKLLFLEAGSPFLSFFRCDTPVIVFKIYFVAFCSENDLSMTKDSVNVRETVENAADKTIARFGHYLKTKK